MDKIWTRWWPPGVDEASIEMPVQPLHAIFKANARRLASKPALIFYGREMTFGELDDASDRFAGWLGGRGVGPGDRVAIFLENCPQFAIAYLGGLKAGAINVCLNPMHKAIELAHEFDDSGAKVLVTSDQAYPVVEPIRGASPLEAVVVTSYADYLPERPTLTVPASFLEPPRPSSDTERFAAIVRDAAPLAAPRPRRLGDTALIQYTSGTTGVPKGAELTHGNVVSNCELQRVFIGVGEEERPLGVLPWFHITGMECQLNMMAYAGATLVALGRFDLETVLRAIQHYRCTVTTLIATINIAIVNWPRTSEFDLTSLRACFSGGAPVPAEVSRRWEAVTGYKLIEGYGLSETTAPTHVNPPDRPKYGTVGVPLPFVDARIVSLEDARHELPIGQSGEIAVRGPMVMKGYWRRPDATAEAIRDGWFLTGDIGRVDEEGYFTIEERKKDMIKASGYSVFPAEVEAIMYRHPAIAEVGVIGVPDPYRGEDVLAFVVPIPGARGTLTEQEVVDWCRREMAAYKAPRQVRFLDALPKTTSGKILKRALRERSGTPPPPPGPGGTPRG
jgi:acyl-CoA synthetase (AMP-forming)/AMP-acid ligase II